jgi:hypothetical protein
LAETIKHKGDFEMFGFGKPKTSQTQQTPPKTEAQILADHVAAGKKAKAEDDWATAAYHFGRAADMTEGAGHEPHHSYFEEKYICRRQVESIIKDLRVQVRRKELGLS